MLIMVVIIVLTNMVNIIMVADQVLFVVMVVAMFVVMSMVVMMVVMMVVAMAVMIMVMFMIMTRLPFLYSIHLHPEHCPCNTAS